jgi:site-specific recombinase XerD
MTKPLLLSHGLEPFLRQMAADGRAASSISSYRRQLQLLIEGLGDGPLAQVTPHQLNDYLTSPSVLSKADGVPKQTSTLNRMKSVVRMFFRWCQQTALVPQNPAVHIRLAVAPPSVMAHMTRQEVRRFLDTIRQGRNPLASRDHALFATLAYTGVRLSDAVRLRRTDLDFGRRRVHLRRTKGGRREQRHVPNGLNPVLRRYLQSLPTSESDPNDYFFRGRNGQPVSSRAVQYRFAFWMRQAGIRKPLSVHSLRHTFGTLLY